MSAISPELDATTLIQRINAGEVPRDFLLMAARGFLPIPQEELVAVLAFLSIIEDEEVLQLARQSLLDLPPRVVLSFARNDQADPAHLDALSLAVSEPAILEAILRNRTTSDQTVSTLAGRVPPNLQEVIVINQERILRFPEILESILSNPEVSADIRRRALEVKEEFFVKQERLEQLRVAALPEEGIIDADLSVIADLLEAAEAADAEPTSPLEIPKDEKDEKKLSVWNQIVQMNVSQKVQLAYKGGKTERAILIRERNKLVSSAVMRNPRMTGSEVELIAAMRNVEDEVLRLIGRNRDWCSKYPIMHALIKNPKSPIGVVLPLINRLTLRDLKNLASDRGVPEVVRTSARRLFQTRKN